MKQVGKVLDKKEGFVTLEVLRQAACGSDCTTCKASCEHKVEVITIVDTLQLEVGDFVELSTSFKGLFAYVMLIYGLPTILFIGSVFLGLQFLPIDDINIRQLAAFGIGLIGITFAVLMIKTTDHKYGKVTTITMERKL